MFMETQKRKPSILMLPWLAHGHISPFLELAKKLGNKNFHIYFCSTPINLNSIKQNLVPKHSNNSIELIELHLPTFPSLPPNFHTTNGLPPHLMSTLKYAFDCSSPNFSNILETLKPDFLIYDFLQPWAPSLASSYNIPSIMFLTTGAAFSSYILHFLTNPSSEFPFSTIYMHQHEHEKTIRSLERIANNVKDGDRVLECLKRSSKVVLIKTFEEIEGKYIDYLSSISGKRHVPVGPLVQESRNIDDHDSVDIIKWLDKKDECSTILVSFGSEYFLSKEEIIEVSHGLELSSVNFIWAIRFPTGDNIAVQEALPQGFLSRVGERGRIIEGWVPQQRILAHSSVCGFVSHCGWSSIMEGMKHGVPIIAMPMQLDQPLNAKLVEEVGVGKEVLRDVNGNLKRGEIEVVIREVMVGENGVKLRRKVKDVSEKMKENMEKEICMVVEELLNINTNY